MKDVSVMFSGNMKLIGLNKQNTFEDTFLALINDESWNFRTKSLITLGTLKVIIFFITVLQKIFGYFLRSLEDILVGQV